MRRKIILAFVAFLLGAAMNSASAEEGYYLSLHAGPLFPLVSDNSGTNISFEIEHKIGFAVSSALGRSWANGFRVEGEISYRRNEAEKVDIDRIRNTTDLNVGVDGNFETLAFMANGAFNLETGMKFSPFILGGIGWARVAANDILRDSVIDIVNDHDWVLAFQLGVGVNYKISDVLKFETAYRFMGTADPDFTDRALGDPFNSEYETHNFMIGFRLMLK
ncbi:outer membrane protein [Nitrospinota bacterium]